MYTDYTPLISLYKDKRLCKKVVAEVRKHEGEGILLLVMDGFDEMPPEVASDQDRLIKKLIDGTCLPRATPVDHLLYTFSKKVFHESTGISKYLDSVRMSLK